MANLSRAVRGYWVKAAVVAVLTLVLAVAFGSHAQAQLPKQGTFSATLAVSGTPKAMFRPGKNRHVAIFQHLGVLTNDAGKGPFHNMSSRCIGMADYQGDPVPIKRVGKIRVHCIWTDRQGDQIFISGGTDEARLRRPSKAAGNIVGGTGKYNGIEGTYEWVRFGVRPAVRGTFQNYFKVNGNWKLP